MLIAQAYAELGNSEKIWRAIHWVTTIHGGKSGGWFERYGPSITPPAPPVCVIGWMWAEVTGLIVRHVFGVRPGLKELVVRPSFLEGVNQMKGRITLRGTEYEMALYRDRVEPYAVIDGKPAKLENGALTLPYPKDAKKVKIEIHF